MLAWGVVTLLVKRARDGDRAAFGRIVDLLCPALRHIAHRRLSRTARDGLITMTTLVNGSDLKFVQRKSRTPADRAHGLADPATVMRSIIAEVMDVSTRTVHRGWDKARLLLAHALCG